MGEVTEYIYSIPSIPLFKVEISTKKSGSVLDCLDHCTVIGSADMTHSFIHRPKLFPVRCQWTQLKHKGISQSSLSSLKYIITYMKYGTIAYFAEYI